MASNSRAASFQIRLGDVIDEIHERESLEAGWDGEDAPAIDPRSIVLAGNLVSAVADRSEVKGYGWRQPEVAPTPEGGVSLSWHLEEGLVWLIVRPASEDVTCVVRHDPDVSTRRVLSPAYATAAVLLELSDR